MRTSLLFLANYHQLLWKFIFNNSCKVIFKDSSTLPFTPLVTTIHNSFGTTAMKQPIIYTVYTMPRAWLDNRKGLGQDTPPWKFEMPHVHSLLSLLSRFIFSFAFNSWTSRISTLQFIFFLIFMAISAGANLPHRHTLCCCSSIKGAFHQMAQFLLIQKPKTTFPKFYREVISYSMRLIKKFLYAYQVYLQN